MGDKCPKCWADAGGAPYDWQCHSRRGEGRHFVQSDACRIRELEAERAELYRLVADYRRRKAHLIVQHNIEVAKNRELEQEQERGTLRAENERLFRIISQAFAHSEAIRRTFQADAQDKATIRAILAKAARQQEGGG